MAKKLTTNPDNLNLKQEEFCRLYASDREFFGNGTQSYIEAYDISLAKPNAYKVAQAAASRLLSNVIVLKRINELLELQGLNDSFIDKQLEFLVTQNSELSTKLAAIREYNKLRGRITDRSEVQITLPTPILGGTSKEVNNALPGDHSN